MNHLRIEIDLIFESLGWCLMNNIEEKALNAIDVDGMLSFLCKMIAVPSLEGSEGEVLWNGSGPVGY